MIEQSRRVIPVLLLSQSLLTKGIRYTDHTYVGDPRNAVRIFNEKEVDELVLLDIDASKRNEAPCLSAISEIVPSAFMPVACGGGVSSVRTAESLIQCGAEKVVLNTAAVADPKLITKCADTLGAQSIVVSIDAKRGPDGRYEVFVRGGSESTGLDPVAWAEQAVAAGCGEIMLGAIDRESTRQGFDLDLVKRVANAVSVPVIASGGAGSLHHLIDLFRETPANAAAVGTMFVFHGPRRAVLISYLEATELRAVAAVQRNGGGA